MSKHKLSNKTFGKCQIYHFNVSNPNRSFEFSNMMFDLRNYLVRKNPTCSRNFFFSQMGIIPFYLSMSDKDIWIQQFALKYYRTFASHCISFLERNESGEIWDIACSAPHRYAAQYDTRILVIIDEFQYFSNHIFFDQNCTNLDKSMPGSYHALVESKIAPMLVSGSYVSWMLSLMEEYLEAGRLDQYYISPYLKPDEGLQAVYKYAEHCNQPITNETAKQINTLCLSDPFFIFCVIKNCRKNSLLTMDGVIDAVHLELTGKHSRMSKTWAEYINKTVAKINDKYAKDILLHLCKHNERTWTPDELKNTLDIDLSNKEIHQRLEQMLEADIIEDGGSDIRYKGLTDGTLYLVLRHRFEEEIKHHKPDFKTDFQEKIDLLEQQKNKKIIPSFLSVSGFTVQAKNLCKEKNIGIAERIEYL